MEDGDPALPLRLATAHLFWPALVHLGEKAFQRLRRPAPQASPNPVKRLYGLEEVRALLDPKRMASKELYVENNLTRFLEAARGEAFADRLQFGRILTLELVAQTVRLGAAPVSCRLPEVEGVHVES
jgi:limonene-1,2-epoxide hydrolase